MLLSTPSFAAFFVIVCLAYWSLYANRRAQQILLLLANCFFLLKFGPVYLTLLLFASCDFMLARRMPGSTPTTKRLLLSASLVLNLGALATLKMLPLVGGDKFDWLLRLSLSFYVFQSLSYTIDIYRGDGKPTDDLLAYLTSALFFPSIVAGPIPRQRKLLREVIAPFRLDSELAARALLLIGTGLVKKLLVADYLADNLVNRIFDTPALYSGLENLVGVYGYALQLFFDFSGYTDLAMGIALLLGIKLPENFRQPYLSINLQDFWKRWHISFSSWLTDYLFESLPKSRQWLRLTYCGAFLVTFLLGGLWHGIAWTFIIWGALHGVGLSVVFLWARWRKARQPGKSQPATVWGKTLGGLLTFHFVCLSWIFFRAESVPQAMDVLRQISTHTISAENLPAKVLMVLGAAAILHCLPYSLFERSEKVSTKLPFWVQGGALAALILIIQNLAGKGSAPFVYGKF
jgi:alginate O-acetyltransferase complex protein AlgI